MSKLKIIDVGLFGVTGAAMLLMLYSIFLYAPIEQTMGVVQKIFYLHLPLAMLSFVSFFLVFLASIAYLSTKNLRWDRWAMSAAEVGVVFCSLVLITGSIWAKPTWNVWWTWDPRLTTVLMLWCMYVAYLMLRKLLDPGDRTSNIAAVFGIVSFINVPITFAAIHLWRTIHPKVFDSEGVHMAAPMLNTLLISFLAMTLFFVVLLRLRIRIEHGLHTYQELLFHAENS